MRPSELGQQLLPKHMQQLSQQAIDAGTVADKQRGGSRPCQLDDRVASRRLLLFVVVQVGIWTRYVEAEMPSGNTEAVKGVFGRCLMQCPSVDLWFMYLKFIKKVGRKVPGCGPGSDRAAGDGLHRPGS